MVNGDSKDRREQEATVPNPQKRDFEKAFNHKKPVFEHYESAPLPKPRPQPDPPKDNGGKK